MSFKLDQQVRHCYERASSYRDRATGERDPRLRQVLTDLEERWLNLAQSYEITEQLSHLDESTGQAHRTDAGRAIQVDLNRLLKVISGPTRC